MEGGSFGTVCPRSGHRRSDKRVWYVGPLCLRSIFANGGSSAPVRELDTRIIVNKGTELSSKGPKLSPKGGFTKMWKRSPEPPWRPLSMYQAQPRTACLAPPVLKGRVTEHSSRPGTAQVWALKISGNSPVPVGWSTGAMKALPLPLPLPLPRSPGLVLQPRNQESTIPL